MPHPISGEWYISVVCGHCSHRILLFHDLSEGESELLRSRIRVMCPKCQEGGSYTAEHYQRPCIALTQPMAGET